MSLRKPFTVGIDVDEVVREWNLSLAYYWEKITGQVVAKEDLFSFNLRDIYIHNVYDPYDVAFGSHVYEVPRHADHVLGALSGIEELRKNGFFVILITNQTHPESRQATLEWVSERLDVDGITFCGNGIPKTIIPCDVYVDDSPKNLSLFLKEKKNYIIFDAPYNRFVQGSRVHNWLELVEELFSIRERSI